jgi:hypothetical protein
MRAALASTMLSLLAALAAAAGCGGKAKPAPTPAPAPAPEPATAAAVSDAELQAQLDAGLVFVNELAAALEAAGGKGCPAVAAAIEDVATRHQATIRASAEQERDPTVRERSQAWVSAHTGELEAAAQKIGTAIEPCAADPAVQAAAVRLDPSAVDESAEQP